LSKYVTIQLHINGGGRMDCEMPVAVSSVIEFHTSDERITTYTMVAEDFAADITHATFDAVVL
jgi:hypothetical protein